MYGMYHTSVTLQTLVTGWSTELDNYILDSVDALFCKLHTQVHILGSAQSFHFPFSQNNTQ